MTRIDAEERRLSLAMGEERVSAILLLPQSPRALFVFAHGAGAGMDHPFMTSFARSLLTHRVASLRYNFPYMERKPRGRPDPKPIAHGTVRAAVAAAAAEVPGVPLIAGGKSFGGRMTSEAQATEPLAAVRGLVFVGFPLHPPKKPSIERAAHLADVHIPMLFLQGTRDELADLDLVRRAITPLADATLQVVDGADHAFHVLKSSGRTDAEVREALTARIAEWLGEIGVPD